MKTIRGRAIVVEIANRTGRKVADERRLRNGIAAVMTGEGMRRASVSLAIVDDPTIQEINRKFLDHDRPTDVLSFLLEQDDGYVEGEIIVSADTAAQMARRFGWMPADELLLYAIHGALHLAGHDDQTAGGRDRMRRREAFYLSEFGLCPRYEERQS